MESAGARKKKQKPCEIVYNKIMPAPAIPATKRYSPICNKPASKRGIIIAPAALLVVVDEDPDELPVDPVPVGAVVTVPVPAEPAWEIRLLQLVLVDPVCVLAFPPKSQAVDAFFWL